MFFEVQLTMNGCFVSSVQGLQRTLKRHLRLIKDQYQSGRSRDSAFFHSMHTSSMSKPGAYITHNATQIAFFCLSQFTAVQIYDSSG